MLFHFLLVVVSSFLVAAYPQNSNTQVDGFVFDGPTAASQSSNGEQRITSTTTTTTTTTESIRGSTTPLSDDQFNACVSSCPVTHEYNPICGTDNTDYTNPGELGCAKRCGKEVTLNHYGRCSTSISG